jgi:sugar-specific transcriptional regulator TrmB
MFQDKDIKALTALGLTALQAKVYLALTKLGQAKIKRISKTTQVARQDLYRIMTELQNRCLAEKVLATPVTFRAVPIHEAVPILLHRLNKQKAEAQSNALQLVERHKDKIPKHRADEDEPKFLLIPEKQALSHKLGRAIEKAQNTVDIVCPRKTFLQALFESSPKLKKALERGVKIRWIIEKPFSTNEAPSILASLSENSLFKLKSIDHNPVKTFSIYDQKRILFTANPEPNHVQSPALWTNSISLVEIAQHYFDTLWNKTEPAQL